VSHHSPEQLTIDRVFSRPQYSQSFEMGKAGHPQSLEDHVPGHQRESMRLREGPEHGRTIKVSITVQMSRKISLSILSVNSRCIFWPMKAVNHQYVPSITPIPNILHA